MNSSVILVRRFSGPLKGFVNAVYIDFKYFFDIILSLQTRLNCLKETLRYS